ncbi:hypothetical protein ACTXMZ_16590 [Brachybacterium alimentarium]|uniref:hypothetical protein n=1 Tax=Brachybacterium alimentarium TaxID=47845 RepID=UPI003FD3F441
MRRRKLKTLARADIGKHIEFTSTQGRSVAGQIRAFTHGVFSHPSAGEIDVPRVLVSVYRDNDHAGQCVPLSLHESHWADPETVARIHPLAEVGLTKKKEARS